MPSDVAEAAAVLETASDRYVIERYLAEGGMGAIYLGKKLGVDGFEKEVVLKQLLPEFTADPKFIDLFLREARISASLEHAHIVQTIDLVAAASEFFIVMEYVRGADLRTLLRRAKRRGRELSAGAVLYIGRALLDALSYAHGRTAPDGKPLGIIHRDISPSNILISGDGEVKLTDFGIAKAATQRSVFYRVKGKVGYMSPEQARAQAIDQRSDLYSLVVCLYEALVGERLFVADLLATPSMIYSQPVVPPSERRPGLPRAIDALFERALRIEPAERFQTADELQEALDQVAFRHELTCSSSEMASHLADVCGAADTWLAEETAADEPRAGTVPIAEDDQARRPAAELISVLGMGSRIREPESSSEAPLGSLVDPEPSGESEEPTRETPPVQARRIERRTSVEREDESTRVHWRTGAATIVPPGQPERPVQVMPAASRTPVPAPGDATRLVSPRPPSPSDATRPYAPRLKLADPHRTALLGAPRARSIWPRRLLLPVVLLVVLAVGVTIGIVVTGPGDPADDPAHAAPVTR